jgi:hypothetical protein
MQRLEVSGAVRHKHVVRRQRVSVLQRTEKDGMCRGVREQGRVLREGLEAKREKVARHYRTLQDTTQQWRTEEGFGGFEPPPLRNSEVLTKLSRIPSSVENTSVTT